MQKYTSKNPKSIAEAPKFVQGEENRWEASGPGEPINVAIVKLRAPQLLDTDLIEGIAKTLSQLRTLGLLSVVVLDCGPEESLQVFRKECYRLCEAIDAYGKPGAKLAQDLFSFDENSKTSPLFLKGDTRVEGSFLRRCLQNTLIPVIPSIVSRDEISAAQPHDSHDVVLSLTRYFNGMQFDTPRDSGELSHSKKIASVERIIVLDSLGCLPLIGRPGGYHRYINIEQEYDDLIQQLTGPNASPLADGSDIGVESTIHLSNLCLTRDALSILPSTASALVTTPFAAANTTSSLVRGGIGGAESPAIGLSDMVTTRRKKNPLLHNLLTDKPVYSSSLPVQRIEPSVRNSSAAELSTAATLVKRGMPLTIYPDPREKPWEAPEPGAPRLRLTDNCIDLPRLVHLIEDSFNRKLDVQDYLNRVNENLAGIIIAGEYQGGAILTWEKPAGLDDQMAWEQGRYVPYLDKFAVLKKSQGSGGVADVVFSAMVRNCLPYGVCWRSRKDNPVNKWYFERSEGTKKLSDSNWTMFWTTNGLGSQHPTLADYESVCRGVEPSWADNKHILD